MAVAEGNFGRLGTGEQQRYTTGNAKVQAKAWYVVTLSQLSK